MSIRRSIRASEMQSFHVIFLGTGIMPHRVAGDKNFLLDLADFLNRNHISTDFVSIADLPILDGTAGMKITTCPRPLHQNPGKYYYRNESGAVIAYHHQHSALREWLELAATLLARVEQLRRTIRRDSRPIIHWTDLTLSMPIIRMVCGKRPLYVCSILRYVPRGRIGNSIRGVALNSADAVITSTSRARDMLLNDGCHPSRLFVAPWGASGAARNGNTIHALRQNPETTRLLWAGFIQQIGREDLLQAVKLAGRVVRARSDIEFTFCLKPESFNESFLSLEQPGLRITVGTPRFASELAGYDAFFSPVLCTESTLAPPLTWIEALSAGLPIITTRASGVEELLTDGESALIFDGYDEIERWLKDEANPHRTLEAMKSGAHEEFTRRYTIDVVGKMYLEVYRNILHR